MDYFAQNLRLLRNRKELSQEELAKEIGIKRSNVDSYERGIAKPKTEIANKFCNYFGISLDDLFNSDISSPEREAKRRRLNAQIDKALGIDEFDDPDYVKPELTVKESSNKEVIPLGKHVHNRLTPEQYGEAFAGWPGVPMYNVPISASFVQHYHDDPVYSPQYYLFDPRFRDCNFGAIISGDSMHSEIRHGDFVALKEIKNKEIIIYGDIYYVVTEEQETCKYINADPENPDRVMLVPRNDKISPMSIRREDIMKLYKVRGIIRGY